MPESPLSALALYTARPTIRINGAEKDRVTGLLLAMEMTEHEDGLSTLELRLNNIASNAAGESDFAFEDEASFKLGDTVNVYCGEESAPTEIFRGIISALEAEFPEDSAPTITALAEDTLQKARMKRRTRTYDDRSIADIARTIAGDLGLTPQITGFTDPVGTQVQLNESDLAFLRRLLARYDGDLQVVGGELHVSPRKDVQRGTVELTLDAEQPAAPRHRARRSRASGERSDGDRLGRVERAADHQHERRFSTGTGHRTPRRRAAAERTRPPHASDRPSRREK
jgi:phage protein D